MISIELVSITVHEEPCDWRCSVQVRTEKQVKVYRCGAAGISYTVKACCTGDHEGEGKGMQVLFC